MVVVPDGLVITSPFVNADIAGDEKVILGTTQPEPPAVSVSDITSPLLLSTVAVAVASDPTPAESVIVTVGAVK